MFKKKCLLTTKDQHSAYFKLLCLWSWHLFRVAKYFKHTRKISCIFQDVGDKKKKKTQARLLMPRNAITNGELSHSRPKQKKTKQNMNAFNIFLSIFPCPFLLNNEPDIHQIPRKTYNRYICWATKQTVSPPYVVMRFSNINSIQLTFFYFFYCVW